MTEANGATGPQVRTDALRRVFGEGEAAVVALADVDVAFRPGELTAIVGPSGSGKSTLMHLCAGLDRPTAGSVWVGDMELGSLPDKQLTQLRRDRLGFVFQFFNLVPVLTAEENIRLPLTIAGRDVDEDRFRALVQRVDIADRLDHRPAELSGGQQQRVAVARAMLSQPDVVFADEPTGNLDTKSGVQVMDMLRSAVDDDHQTVVVVTHDPRVASYADRVLVLRDGKIVTDAKPGTTDEVLELMKEL
ncbi:MAG: ABC transporter ATP-binding protein [Solirubrobacterales bacterium]